MKKFKKLFLAMTIIGIIFVLLGGTIFTITLANNDWNIANLDSEKLTAVYFLDQHDRVFDEIEFTGNWRYTIKMGETFRVDYFNSNLSDITISQTRNDRGNYTFSFYEDRPIFSNAMLLGMNGIKRTQSMIYITVTQSIFACFNGASSRINANGIDFNEFNLRGSSSRINIKNSCLSGDMTITGSSINIEFDNVKSSQAIKLDGSSTELNLSNSQVDTITSRGSSTRFNFSYSQIRYINIDGASSRITASYSHMHTLRVTGASFRATLNLYGVTENLSALNINGANRRVNIDGISGAGQGFKRFYINGASARLNITMLGGTSAFAS
ncbi:MAG: hypothetical protein FWE03_06290 [Firmicutes bacterium]|nr:hypothetical protein [Bacillota bacterium]